ncbi:MAG: DUF2203 family protein [Planctomycetota bacterium]
MKNNLYDRSDANALVPLLNSIIAEIQERGRSLERLERRIDTLSSRPAKRRGDPQDLHNLVADAAVQRREVRLAKEELLKLGCSIVGTDPITVRIPGQRGNARRSFVYRSGDPVLK